MMALMGKKNKDNENWAFSGADMKNDPKLGKLTLTSETDLGFHARATWEGMKVNRVGLVQHAPLWLSCAVPQGSVCHLDSSFPYGTSVLHANSIYS